MIRYHARWVLPISRPPLADGTVVEHEGRIVYVGPRANAPTGEDRDLGDAALLPGLVNVHTHLELTAFRGLLEGLDFRGWIVQLQAAKRAAMTRERYLDAARLGIAEGLRAGITTYADTCDSGVALDAMRELGVRGIMYQEVFGPAPEQCAASMAELRAKMAAHAASSGELIAAGVSPHAPYTVSPELFRAVAAYALGERLPVAIHIAESDAEMRLVRDGAGPFADALRARDIPIRAHGRTPIAWLDSLGVLATRPLLIHCVRADAEDIETIARAACTVAHCPASNAKLGHGIAPLVEMLDAGIAVGLGSDSVASNDRMDLLDEGRLAALMQRARRGDPLALAADRVLELATLGGARALRLADRVGSLEVGKEADLVAFPLDDDRSRPVNDPASALVFGGSGRATRFVAVAGHVRVWNGELADADRGLAARVDRIASDLARWRATGGPAR